MNPSDQQNNHFDAELPLPDEAQPSNQSPQKQPEQNPAAELIRKKVADAYGQEPNAGAEVLDMAELGVKKGLSRHQQFVNELTTSGKSLADIQEAWHVYYAGLSDTQKHEVWKEFYDAHAQASKFAAAMPALAPEQLKPSPIPRKKSPTHKKQNIPTITIGRTIADLKRALIGNTQPRKKLSTKNHLHSLAFGLSMGALVVLILLFSFFNERFIAPLIQPSRNVTNTPIISSNAPVSRKPEVIIPKINVEAPVVYGVNTINEAAIAKALENGVVHYADTALPGQDGNIVIVGHSSSNIFNVGKYKFAFVLLSRLSVGDTFFLQKDGKRYTYQIYKKEVIKPTDVGVLAPTDKLATATLITCDPPGTNFNRMVVIGEQISPNPSTNTAATTQNTLAEKTSIIPGNSQTLWSRLISWLKR
jgi:LPXTG-site transpeptidase (sortase) family protein